MANIIEYMPLLMAGYVDFETVCAAENPEFDLLNEQTANADNDHILAYASEARVSEWEKMLDATPITEISLDKRRQRLQDYLSQPPNYALQNVLDELSRYSISHTASYQIWYEDCYFEVDCDIPAETWAIIYNKLINMIPANVTFVTNNTVPTQMRETLYCGGATSRRINRRIGF